MKRFVSIALVISMLLLGCKQKGGDGLVDKAAEEAELEPTMEVVDTLGLVVFYPNYTRVDLVCGTMPEKSDASVIFVAEASYTGECLKEFNHRNIAGDHVSSGQRFKGYKCRRNTGAFVYYDGKGMFCKEPYSAELDRAARNGGAGFGQELILYKGKAQVTPRKDSNRNQFRALCSRKDRLCIVESKEDVAFGDFRKALLDYGISDAIYLDMGPGWNHAWCRIGNRAVDLHPKKNDFCTNWITFYRE